METKRGAVSNAAVSNARSRVGAGRVSVAGAAILLALTGVGCAEGLSGNGVFDDSARGAGGDGGGSASGDGGGGGARSDGPASTAASTSVASSSSTTTTSTAGTTTASTTTSTGGGCTAADFDCGDGNCVALALACNGVADCWGATDEAPQNPQCGGATTGATTGGGGTCPGQFMCGDGSCIDPDWECDGWPDCFDFSDEASCPCDGFTCGDGECISASWECDDYIDCSDGSDEVDCGGGGGAWTCDPSYIGDGDCDCGCGELDVDCPTGSSAAECDYCGLTGSCASSCADIDPSQNWTCL